MKDQDKRFWGIVALVMLAAVVTLAMLEAFIFFE
jgi:hypothetical protein